MSVHERAGIQAVQAIIAAGQGEVEGMSVIPLPHEKIKDGDWYIAGFNTGPHLRSARKVDEDNGWIISEEPGYAFDTVDCVKVQVPDLVS